MTPWSPISVLNVADNTGDLTQLFPAFATVGSGATTAGTLVRKCQEGVLYRVDVDPTDAVGGVLELWDLGGRPYDFAQGGGNNNINTGTTLKNAYLTAEQTAGRARMIWRTDFKGDAGLTTKTFATRVPFGQGLAARFIDAVDAVGTKAVIINVIAEGGFTKVGIAG